MFSAVLALVVLVSPSVLGGKTLLANNPELGAYQDVIECFPANGTLYLIQRNFESDPYFGEESKCVTATQHGPVKKDTTSMTIAYGDTKRDSKMTFLSAPGYDVRNVVNLKYRDGSHETFNLTVGYVECPKCHLLLADYIDGGAGCMLWVPESALNDDNKCCYFVYDLLCGTSPKYQIYEGCQ